MKYNPTPKLLGILAILACAASGCADSASQAEVVLTEEEGIFGRICACYEALSTPSEDDCYSTFVARTPAERACVLRLFETHEAEIARTVECQLEVIDAAHRCLDEIVACDQQAVRACLVEGLAARGDCGSYVDAVEQGLDVCYGVGASTN